MSIEHKNMITFETEQRIKNSIKPLLHRCDIHYLCYGVSYPDTSGFTLTTHSSYFKAMLEQKFHMRGFSLPNGWTKNVYLAPNEKEFSLNLEIDHQLCYINRTPDKTELFIFGTNPDNNNINNFYYNNLTFLKRFTKHFTEEVSDLIGAAQDKLMIPHPSLLISPNPNYKPEVSLNNQIVEDGLYPYNILSPREKECFQLILKGYNNTQIAQASGISLKTIDCYITRLKQKLGCSTRIDLFKIATQLQLYHCFMD